MLSGSAKQLSLGDTTGAPRPTSGRSSRELLFDSEAILRLVDGALTDLRASSDPPGIVAPDEPDSTDPAHVAASTPDEIPGAVNRLLEDVRAGRIALSGRRLPNLYGDSRIRELTSASAMLDHVGRALLLVDTIENGDAADGADPLADLRHELFRVMNCLQFHAETLEKLERALSLLASTESRLAEISRMLDRQGFESASAWDDLAGPVLRDHRGAGPTAGMATDP